MKLCITGANSSVGRNLLQHLAQRDDHSAVALVRSAAALAGLPSAPNLAPAAAAYEDHAALLAACRGVLLQVFSRFSNANKRFPLPARFIPDSRATARGMTRTVLFHVKRSDL
jgi:uncharacterized protein YbjT (DUF2867 family)